MFLLNKRSMLLTYQATSNHNQLTIYLRVYGLILSGLRLGMVFTLTNGLHLMTKFYSIAMIFTMFFVGVCGLAFIYGVATRDWRLMIDASQLAFVCAAIGLPTALVTKLIDF